MMDFSIHSSREIYASYLKRVHRVVSPLSKADREDIVMEINSHIHEHMAAQGKGDEVNDLLQALKDLGEPEEFLVAQVGQRKLDQATRSFNPIDILLALWMNIGSRFYHSVVYSLLGLFYLLTFVFAFFSLFKIVLPNQIGYFISPSGSWAIGYVHDTSGMKDAWGYWFIPFSIGVTLVLYVVLTLLLKVVRKV
jgi:uncharacterized membrane protein